jgi:hypothetical protein
MSPLIYPKIIWFVAKISSMPIVYRILIIQIVPNHCICESVRLRICIPVAVMFSVLYAMVLI